MKRGIFLGFLGLVGWIVACDWPILGYGCEDYGVPGLEITVVDRESGSPVMNALVWIKDGKYVDTLDATWGHALGADEREGQYVIFVEHPDYEPWKRKGVKVKEEDRCHVKTTSVRAELKARQ